MRGGAKQIWKEKMVAHMLDISKILERLDGLFLEGQPDKVETYLIEQIAFAKKQKDENALITLFNEMIGYCRDMGKFEMAVSYCSEVIELMKKNGYENTIPYATTLLNVGNAYRGAGLLKESEQFFLQVAPIYDKELPLNDFRYASLYNNMSILYQEMRAYEKACQMCEKALQIALSYPNAKIEAATTRTNLALSLMQLGKWEEAYQQLSMALTVYESYEKKDYHYSAALSAMGQYYMNLQQYDTAVFYFDKAKDEIAKHVGKSGPGYEAITANLESAMKLHKTASVKTATEKTGKMTKGMELCRAYYEAYGKQMLQEQFPEYARQIAVGLIGEGSDCLGFDDELSKDHDYGPRFCMWISASLYEKIGDRLQKAYENLPVTLEGVTRNMTDRASFREGVMITEQFVAHLIGSSKLPKNEGDWKALLENGLYALTSGELWEEGDGVLCQYREKLAYYPESFRKKKIAQSLAMMAQNGQYNLPRLIKRGEQIGAAIALTNFMQETMKTVYLLNHRYAPFYKWLHRGMDALLILPEIMDILRALWDYKDDREKSQGIIEIIAKLIVEELKKQGLTTSDELFLERQAYMVAENDNTEKEVLIEKLVKIEWEAFDKVDNEGGRADCQDDWETFSIMRRSQFMTWETPMLESFIKDFEAANEAGWNLIAEKYGRMMEYTCKEEYDKIKSRFPEISDKKKAIISQIAQIQVAWMEEFAKQYPMLAGNARVIHETENTFFRTSYETYLKGELMTYSDETLALYGQFIVKLSGEGRNLAKEIMENTVKLYGYSSLEEAEQKEKEKY